LETSATGSTRRYSEVAKGGSESDDYITAEGMVSPDVSDSEMRNTDSDYEPENEDMHLINEATANTKGRQLTAGTSQDTMQPTPQRDEDMLSEGFNDTPSEGDWLDEQVNEILNEISSRDNAKWKLKTKGGLKMAFLNMRGRILDSENKQLRRQCKFKLLASYIRAQKFAFIALQETHLNNTLAASIEAENPNIKLLSSGNSTLAGGVAFMLNKDLTKTEECQMDTLIEGRAMWAKITTKSASGNWKAAT